MRINQGSWNANKQVIDVSPRGKKKGTGGEKISFGDARWVEYTRRGQKCGKAEGHRSEPEVVSLEQSEIPN